MAAAVDPRVDLSIPVAGALPLYARPFSPGSEGDIEQFYEPLYREIDSSDSGGVPDRADCVASWLEIFALGGVAPRHNGLRRQIQAFNYYDACCFGGDVYRTYDRCLRDLVAGIGTGRWAFPPSLPRIYLYLVREDPDLAACGRAPAGLFPDGPGVNADVTRGAGLELGFELLDERSLAGVFVVGHVGDWGEFAAVGRDEELDGLRQVDPGGLIGQEAGMNA